jgi:hypothetical protein
MSSQKKPEGTKISLKKFISHPNFYLDFRQIPFNWFLIFLSLIAIIITAALGELIIITIQITLFLILLLISGDWQKLEYDSQFLDVLIYLILAFFLLGIYVFTGNLLLVFGFFVPLWLYKKYLMNRESKIAYKLKELR